MNIIHCADLHLDSALSTHLTSAQAEQRRNEILLAFQNMVRFAVAKHVRLILIAGDLFDTNIVSQKTRQVVLATIESAPTIDFIYLKGNHDELTAFANDQIPFNLKMITKNMQSFSYDGVEVTGILNHQTASPVKLDSDSFHIVMMHGQVSDQKSWKEDRNQEKAQIIYLNELMGKNIDYLALGHIHSYQKGRLDSRGTYCYSGCLEPRGFDETGEKGFVFLKTGSALAFVPFAKRKAEEYSVDVTGCISTPEICAKIEQSIATIEKKDMVKVVLKGELSAEMELNLQYIFQRFAEVYFAFRIEDETILSVDIDNLMKEDSMKGLFVRTVLASNEDMETKRQMIRYGMKALSGEEIHI